MSPMPDDRLQRLLGGERFASLRRRLRQRFERAVADEDPGRLRIDNLTRDEHAVLVSLLGRSPRFTHSLQIDVVTVDDVLRQAGIAVSLRDALEQLDGPIIHIATARSALLALWSDVAGGCDHAGLATFLGTPAGMGLVKRLSGGEPDAAIQLRRRLEAVLRRLPANGLTRAQLAAEVLGDAHALDDGQPTATLVLAVWRQTTAAARPEAGDPMVDAAADAETRSDAREEKARDVWARAGVLVNELARPAMFLNLPTYDKRSHGCAPGDPGYLSLRSLLRSSPAWDVAGQDIYVCENPNLLAIAADALGARCAPLVCTDGMPAAAQNRLLAQLAQAGARLHYHGDFDWPGLRIANHVMREHGVSPWRFEAKDYVDAVAAQGLLRQCLQGPETVALWDDALTPTMRAHRLAIAEEGVAASLLTDLAG